MARIGAGHGSTRLTAPAAQRYLCPRRPSPFLLQARWMNFGGELSTCGITARALVHHHEETSAGTGDVGRICGTAAGTTAAR